MTSKETATQLRDELSELVQGWDNVINTGLYFVDLTIQNFGVVEKEDPLYSEWRDLIDYWLDVRIELEKMRPVPRLDGWAEPSILQTD